MIETQVTISVKNPIHIDDATTTYHDNGLGKKNFFMIWPMVYKKDIDIKSDTNGTQSETGLVIKAIKTSAHGEAISKTVALIDQNQTTNIEVLFDIPDELADGNHVVKFLVISSTKIGEPCVDPNKPEDMVKLIENEENPESIGVNDTEPIQITVEKKKDDNEITIEKIEDALHFYKQMSEEYDSQHGKWKNDPIEIGRKVIRLEWDSLGWTQIIEKWHIVEYCHNRLKSEKQSLNERKYELARNSLPSIEKDDKRIKKFIEFLHEHIRFVTKKIKGVQGYLSRLLKKQTEDLNKEAIEKHEEEFDNILYSHYIIFVDQILLSGEEIMTAYLAFVNQKPTPPTETPETLKPKEFELNLDGVTLEKPPEKPQSPDMVAEFTDPGAGMVPPHQGQYAGQEIYQGSHESRDAHFKAPFEEEDSNANALTKRNAEQWVHLLILERERIQMALAHIAERFKDKGTPFLRLQSVVEQVFVFIIHIDNNTNLPSVSPQIPQDIVINCQNLLPQQISHLNLIKDVPIDDIQEIYGETNASYIIFLIGVTRLIELFEKLYLQGYNELEDFEKGVTRLTDSIEVIHHSANSPLARELEQLLGANPTSPGLLPGDDIPGLPAGKQPFALGQGNTPQDLD